MADKKLYTLMLVDDEPWALIGIRECIDWEAAGFRVAAECDCGEAALEAAEKLRPDAVITDIRMPDMSGLDLVRQLRERMPAVQCVVVSAYSDFEVAREALRLMAIGYMLKPFQEKEVLETAARLYARIREERGEQEVQPGTSELVSEEDPVLPEIPYHVRSLWLVINEHPLSPALWKKDSWITPVRTAHYYGVLCESMPEETPEETGISAAISRGDDPKKLFRTAEASMYGGFFYPPDAGFRNAATIAARIQFYLYRNMAETISLKDLADEFFLTETYLCDLFKQETGKTILGFLKELRMRRAAQLLGSTEETIVEIAAQCGYNDYSYFGRHFKSAYGCTPDQYRRMKR